MKQILIIFVVLVQSTRLLYSQELIWKHTEGPMGGIVGDMAINSKGAIYAGVYSFWIDYSGLYKSTDNGESWNKIKTQFDDFEVYAIYITKEDHIWVGTNFQGRIYRSTDNGLTWENKRNGYNTGECWAFGQSKDGVIFAGDGQYFKLYRSTDYGENWILTANLRPLVFATDSNNIVYTGTHDGLFATSDNGLTWAQNNFLANIPVSSILIDPNNNIYCGTGYYNNGNGVFYSTDGGQNWIHLGLAGEIVLSLAFDSQGNLYAGTKQDGLYKTTDSGQSWLNYNNGIYRKEVFRLKLNKQDDIFIGSENEGVFRSTNSGESFEHIGLPISKVNNIVFSGDSLIIASTPSGIQKYNRITRKWSNLGLQNVEAVSITFSNYLYAATFDEGLYRSTDLGNTWSLTNLTQDSLMSAYNVLAINDDTIFASTEFNLRRSFNGGESWDVLSVSPDFFRRGLIFNTNTNTLFATGYKEPNYILYASSNYGNNFDSIMVGFNIVETNGLDSFGNYITLADANSFGGIFISYDNGQSWSKLINNKNMRSIYIGKEGTLLAGALDSLYYSDDYGISLKSIPYQLKNMNYVTEITTDINNKIFFGTYIEGLYEIDLITGIGDEANFINNYYLTQNYPNPFNPVTKIKLFIPKEELVQLKIYNILGKELKTLLNEYKQTGVYEVEFDGSNLPSGVYFYRMISGSFAETKKMILLR